MLTKSDKKWLQQIFVNKDELNNLVTKKDAKNFATKNDLKNLVTKNDLKKYATKEDLKKAFIGVARSSELDDLKETFVTNLEKWKNELFNKIDDVLGQLKSAEQEKAILEIRQDERQKLEGRVQKLEKIHPNNRHSFP